MTHSFARRSPSPALYPSRSLEAGVTLEAGGSPFYEVCVEGVSKEHLSHTKSLTPFLVSGYIARKELGPVGARRGVLLNFEM